MSIAELPGQIQIRDSFEGEPFTIRRLEPHEPHTSLGCVITISGNQVPQFETLETKIQDWKARITASTLKGDEKLTAYDSYLKESMKYVLPTTCLTKYQCAELDKIIAPVLLNALSTHRKVSRIVLYSPERHGGYGVFDVWHLQGCEKLKYFIMHYRRHDITGQLLKISLQWLQMEAGVSTPFYKFEYDMIEDILTNCWIKHLYWYLDSCKAKLHEVHPWTYTAPRENDFFLQEVFINSDLPRARVTLLNEVRMALRLITVSDIVAINKSSLVLPYIYECKNYRGSTLEWPRCEEINDNWKSIWKKCCSNNDSSYSKKKATW